MSSTPMLNTQSCKMVTQWFEAPVPPATVGVQVTALRPGDSIGAAVQSGQSVTVAPDPTDPSGFTFIVTGVVGKADTPNVVVTYQNADTKEATTVQGFIVTNGSDVVSGTSTVSTPS